jgi:hypothetical protein
MAKRRIAAFGVDYLVIAVWIGLITAIGFGARALLGIETGPIVSQADKLRGHALAFLTLTLPVILYFRDCGEFSVAGHAWETRAWRSGADGHRRPGRARSKPGSVSDQVSSVGNRPYGDLARPRPAVRLNASSDQLPRLRGCTGRSWGLCRSRLSRTRAHAIRPRRQHDGG